MMKRLYGKFLPMISRFLSHRIAPWLIVSSLVVAYSLAFPWLDHTFGVVGRSLCIVHIVTAAWFWGFRGGLAVALLNTPLLFILSRTAGVELPGWPLGHVLMILFGAFIGRLRDLGLRLNEELLVRQRTEQELKRSQDRLEDTVRERTADLRRSEERYRLLAENVADVIWTLGLDLRTDYISPSVESLRGYSPEEAKAHSLEEVLTPDSFRRFRDALDREWDRFLGGEWKLRTMELEFSRKDGSTVWTESTLSGLYDDQGKARNILGVCRDISERRSAEEEKEKLEDQLRQAQKMEAVGRLAGGVAHDFNNLLTAISGYSSLLLSSLEEGDPLRLHVEEIRKAEDRASSLTRQLLAFSRKQVLQPEVMDLNTTVADLKKLLQRLIGEDVEFVTILDPELGTVEMDPGQIQQVILNLAVNAKDAMPMGGKLTLETSNVELSEEYARKHEGVEPGSYVMLAMSDTGAGMDEETRKKIFEPFFTTKGMEKGTGLGLATVYGIVKQSGGHIWVYSELECGSVFKVYLPRVFGKHTDVRPDVRKAEELTGTETVLLVEDEESVRTLVSKILQKSGYRLFEAKNGEEALDICMRHNEGVHLVITDVIMPRMSGRELADRLTASNPDLQVLYISGYTDNAIVHHGVLDSGVAFLEKPFTPGALLRKVREVLDASGVKEP